MKEFIKLDHAVEILNAHGVVAVPTETVYGLAAKIDSQTALQKIFDTKDRPLFDPLIVHISDLEMLDQYVTNPDPILLKLAKRFWPGPLTLVFDKNSETVSDLITAGSQTVAIRWPQHKLTVELIAKLGTPIAAPSANPFKKTSPTEAHHVRDYFPELAVLDGGSCTVGLESTIVKLSGDTLHVLRPGQITTLDLKNFLQDEGLNLKVVESFDLEGPGSMKEHYQPKAPLYIFKDQKLDLGKSEFKDKRIKVLELDPNPKICARLLYKSLIEGSADADILVMQWHHDLNDPNWSAIFNRLQKAAKVIY